MSNLRTSIASIAYGPATKNVAAVGSPPRDNVLGVTRGPTETVVPRMTRPTHLRGGAVATRARGGLSTAILLLVACTRSGSRPSIGASEAEDRTLPATADDVRILEGADAILASEEVWNRHDDRECPRIATTWSLYCALHEASLERLGRYEHRRAALQEVRFVIEERTNGRAFEHRLRDYNNLPETSLADVKAVLQESRRRICMRVRECVVTASRPRTP